MFHPGTAPTLDDLLRPAPTSPFGEPRLGLTADELEAGIVAVVDRDDFTADVDTRARLARVRAALEGELARMLAQ